MAEDIHAQALKDFLILKRSLQDLIVINRDEATFEYKDMVITIKDRNPKTSFSIIFCRPIFGIAPGMNRGTYRTLVNVSMVPSDDYLSPFKGNVGPREALQMCESWVERIRERKRIMEELEQVIEPDNDDISPELSLFNEFKANAENKEPKATLSKASQEQMLSILQVVDSGIRQVGDYDSISEEIIQQLDYIRTRIDSLRIEEIILQLQEINEKVNKKPQSWQNKLAVFVRDAVFKLAIAKTIEHTIPIIAHMLGPILSNLIGN